MLSLTSALLSIRLAKIFFTQHQVYFYSYNNTESRGVNYVRINMVVYNLVGRRHCSAISRKNAFKCFYCFDFSAYTRFFVKNLIETNVNISNELNIFSDVYRSVKHNGSLAKFTCTHSLCTQTNVVYTSIKLRKMKFIP